MQTHVPHLALDPERRRDESVAIGQVIEAANIEVRDGRPGCSRSPGTAAKNVRVAGPPTATLDPLRDRFGSVC